MKIKKGTRIGDRVCIGKAKHLIGKCASQQKVLMKCDCGRIDEVILNSLRGKNPRLRCRGCACVLSKETNTTYGAGEPFGSTVGHIFGRCLNPHDPAYEHYMGRGIGIWQPWLKNKLSMRLYLVKLWIEQTGLYTLELYGPGADQLTLDRIDNDGDYEPGNLRFTDKITQNRNSRRYL